MPKYRKPNRGRRAVPTTLPAPTGGLNGRDALAEMPHKDAFVLDNWFPNSTTVDTRGGSLDYSTGLPGAVESLEVYTGAAGAKMLAFSNGGIYDVTAGGAVGAALLGGQASSKVTSCMFSNAGSQFMLIYSGADAPLSYNGAALAGLVITGLTGSQNLIFAAMAFKGRVLLAQTGMLGFYYLAVGAIQGAASYFDLQQQSVRGGSLAAICSISQEDNGTTPQDYAVFVTTEGEYIVYNGTDPSSAANWALVGRYFGPPPIGKKGWFRYRGDVYFITEEGILSLTQIRETSGADPDKYISAKLGRNYSDLTSTFQATHGWCGLTYPRGKSLIVNVPSSSGVYYQFAMNTNTGAWCRFTGWNGLCFNTFNRRMYFGTQGGKVVLADQGFTDNGAQVTGSARQAWNTFDADDGIGDEDKQFHFATFALLVDGAPSLSCAVNVNFEDDRPQDVTGIVTAAGADWDTSDWDTTDWGGTALAASITVPVGKVGYVGSLWFQATSLVSKVQWYSSRVILEKLRGVLVQ